MAPSTTPTPFGETHPEHWAMFSRRMCPTAPLETPFRFLGSVS